MKRSILPVAAALTAVAWLGGCASFEASVQSHVIDQEKVVAVNQAAARSGVRVIWVNPPTKLVGGRGG